MKISGINIINPYGFNFKSKKNNSPSIKKPEKNGDIAQFASNPFAKLYEAKLNFPLDNTEKTEYFQTEKDEFGEDICILLGGTIIEDAGKLKLAQDASLSDFKGIAVKKINNEIVQEIRYIKGYPMSITDYKDGKEYKYTHFSQNSHKINHVYYFDRSFELSQKSGPQNSYLEVEYQRTNKYGEKYALNLTATNKQDVEGKAQCQIPTDDGYKTIELKWDYFKKYSFDGSKEDAKNLQNALDELKDVINKDEYKKDFGSNDYLNKELSDAIKYLENV